MLELRRRGIRDCLPVGVKSAWSRRIVSGMAGFLIRANADAPARGPYQLSRIQELVDSGRLKSHHEVSKDGRDWYPLGRMKSISWPTADADPVDEADGFLAILDEAVSEADDVDSQASRATTRKLRTRPRLLFDEWDPIRRGFGWMHTAAVAHYYYALITLVQFIVQVVVLMFIITLMLFGELMSSGMGLVIAFFCPLFAISMLVAFFRLVLQGSQVFDALYGGSRGFYPMILERVGWGQLVLMIGGSFVVVVVLPTQAPAACLLIQGLLALMVVFACGCEAVSSIVIGIRAPDPQVKRLGIGAVLCNLVGLMGVIGAPTLSVANVLAMYANSADESLAELGKLMQRLTGGQLMGLPMILLLSAALLGPAGKAICLSRLFARISELCGKTEEQAACWEYGKQAVGLSLFRNGLIVAAIVVVSELGVDGDGAEIIVLVPFLLGFMAMTWFAVSECTLFEERAAAAHDGLIATMR